MKKWESDYLSLHTFREFDYMLAMSRVSFYGEQIAKIRLLWNRFWSDLKNIEFGDALLHTNVGKY